MKQQRNTKQKQMVLEAVCARGDHPTADQIFLDVRVSDDKISRGTVYRNLSQLSESGTLNRVKVPGADRFDWRVEKHCHLICTGCGQVCDVPIPYREADDRELSQKTGYLVSRHRTVFEGLCPVCRRIQTTPQSKE